MQGHACFQTAGKCWPTNQQQTQGKTWEPGQQFGVPQKACARKGQRPAPKPSTGGVPPHRFGEATRIPPNKHSRPRSLPGHFPSGRFTWVPAAGGARIPRRVAPRGASDSGRVAGEAGAAAQQPRQRLWQLRPPSERANERTSDRAFERSSERAPAPPPPRRCRETRVGRGALCIERP